VQPSPSADGTALPAPTRAPDAAVPWVLFFRYDDRQLWRLRPGTDEVGPALAGGPAEVSGEADWSPDGRRFAFIGRDADGSQDLWAADWDGTDAARLVDCAPPCAQVGGPAWSPDGRSIAFWRLDVSGDSLAGSSLRTLDVASGVVSTVLESRPPRVLALPRWSGDGRRLVTLDAVVSVGTSAPAPEVRGASLAVVDLSSSPPAVRRLVEPEMFAGSAAWHPTEDLIVFSAGALDPFDPQHPTSELYTIHPDGSGLTRLTDLESIDGAAFWPAWSPDGSAILFSLVHRGAGTITLATVRPDGSELDELGVADRIVGAFARQRPAETTAPASSTPAP
jgi:Tol biopolymer transport system component